ncbi:hypothetical protein PRIPAC_81221 [Pristionchus pacificus]|uniref:Saposin B-type domain-containing protein n=1 Tax=Pristionchus pacificus TaxID=54126 RepID=A0A454XT38_PRIPA|nr:hypothetical protein PRIPAC_81221 [Pristionchus pacificus]|eukprot:PDM78998.1 hypothetical protein PRIPAC_31577 [Pristionchus pacificus]
MRSAILLLAIVAAVSATAIRQQPKKEHLTKEIKHHTKEERVQNAAKVHQKLGNLSGKAYFQALVASGKDAALKDELCKMCIKLITDIETFGEDTALDYLEPEVEIMCDGLPWDNLKKDCTDWVMSIVDDLVDILNDYTDGENACVAMTLCDA